jgi:anti-anti-sigma regulatory factor
MKRFLQFRQWSLQAVLAISIMAAVVLTAAIGTILSIRREQESFRTELQDRASVVLDILAVAAGDQLYTLDKPALVDLTQKLGQSQVVLAVETYDANGVIVTSTALGTTSTIIGRQLIATDQTVYVWREDRLLAGRSVSAGSQRFGAFSVELSTATLEAKTSAARTQGIVGGLAVGVIGAFLALLLSRSITGPIQDLTVAARRLADGEVVQMGTSAGSAELRTLAETFQRMATTIHQREAEATLLNSSLQRTVGQLEETVGALKTASQAREQLAAVVRELSSPVIPVLEGILVMPLVGVIDSERAEVVLTSLLRAVEREKAHTAILDLTGVPVVDAEVAGVVLQAVMATRLLGTEALLVGLRPELAQTIIALGIDVGDLVTLSDLQHGIAYALQRQRALRSGA